MQLTRDNAFKNQSRWRRKRIDLSEVRPGMFAYVQKIPASAINSESGVIEYLSGSADDRLTQMAAMCVACLCDEHGTPVFTVNDMERLKTWPLMALAKCVDAISTINDGVDAKKNARRSKKTARSSSRSG
jgi:hypothetical protein